MSELVINDTNYRDFIGDGESVIWDGEKRLLSAYKRVTPFGGYTNIPTAKPELLIPRSKWDEYIELKDREKSWLIDFITPTELLYISEKENQRDLGYCWVYTVTICAMINRIKQNLGLIALSAESVGGPITNWKNQGGWPENALQRFISHGACPQSFLDQPNSLNYRGWKDDWKTEALKYRTTEWIDLDFSGKTFDALVSAAFWDIPCACTYNWWAHAITGGLKVRKVGNKYQVLFMNSWGPTYGETGTFWMEEGKGTPEGGLFGISQMIPSQ